MTKQKKTTMTMKTMQQLYENRKLTMDDLADVKFDLKRKINEQQSKMQVSMKQIIPFTKDSTTINLNNKKFLPLSLITTPIRKGRAISVAEGILVGYKVMKSIRRFIRR